MPVIVVTRLRLKDPVDGEPHLGISTRLDHYCDEATFVDWEQTSPQLPDWQTSWRHLTADGQVAELSHPSAAHQARDFPPPVQPPLERFLNSQRGQVGRIVRRG